MGRARGSSGGRSSFRPARNPPKRDNQMSATSPTPPAKTGTIPSTGLVSSLFDGFGWSAGWSIGQRAMDAIFGPREFHHKVTPSAPAPTSAQSIDNGSDNLGSSACVTQSSAFLECLNSNKADISNCQFYMDMLSECRGNGIALQA